MSRLMSILGLVAMIALPLRFAYLHGKDWEFRGGRISSIHHTLPDGRPAWWDGTPMDPLNRQIAASGASEVIMNVAVLVVVACGCWVFHMDRSTRKLRREVQVEMDRIWPERKEKP
jgi:hypothetical protein